MIKHLKTLYAYRELVWIWTLRSIKIRYKQSLLGGAWAVLQPLSLMVIFSIIFTHFVKVSTGDIPYPLFSYSALVPWTFLGSSISFAVPSLVQNMNLVTKIFFPREIIPFSAVLASFVDFMVASVVFLGMILFYQVPLSINLIIIPVIIAVQFLLTLGIVLFASAVNVFYRDIRFVVPLVVQLWMYATPIIYPLTVVPERLRALYMLNPMAVLIEAYRVVSLRGIWPDWRYLGIATVISLSIFAFGYQYFKRVEWQFADII